MPGEPSARATCGLCWWEQHPFALESQGWGHGDEWPSKAEKDSRDPQPEARGCLRAALPAGGLLGSQHQTNPAGLGTGFPQDCWQGSSLLAGRTERYYFKEKNENPVIALFLLQKCWCGPSRAKMGCESVPTEEWAHRMWGCEVFPARRSVEKKLPAWNPKSLVKAEPFDPPLTSLFHQLVCLSPSLSIISHLHYLSPLSFNPSICLHLWPNTPSTPLSICARSCLGSVREEEPRLWNPRDLSSSPSPATYWLCGVGQGPSPLWASAVSSVTMLDGKANGKIPSTQ